MAFKLSLGSVEIVTNSATVVVADADSCKTVSIQFPFTPDGNQPESKMRAAMLNEARKIQIVSETLHLFE